MTDPYVWIDPWEAEKARERRFIFTSEDGYDLLQEIYVNWSRMNDEAVQDLREMREAFYGPATKKRPWHKRLLDIW